MAQHKKPDIFNRFTSQVATILGHAWVFTAAFVLLIIWGVSGPLFGFSDTWQLVVNTSTTIVTFLMVFIIQNTQNRDNMAMNLKLDLLMKKMGVTEDEFIEAEEQSDVELEKEKKRVQKSGRSKRR